MCCTLAPRVQAGDVIGEAWDQYKAHWQHLLPFALVVYLILGLVSLVLTLALGWIGAILGAFIGIIGVFWLQGALVDGVESRALEVYGRARAAMRQEALS